MIAASLSILCGLCAAVVARGRWRALAFVASTLISAPLVAYVVEGTRLVVSRLSAQQVLRDFGDTAARCYTEPWQAAFGDSHSTAIVMLGAPVTLASLWAAGQLGRLFMGGRANMGQ